MKRFAAIFISMLVLLIAVQPMLAFHFCSGMLVSVEVQSGDHTKGCCSGTHNTDGESIIKDSCCHTSTATLSADNYIHKEARQQTLALSISSLILFSNIPADLTSTEPSGSSWHRTPPGSPLSGGKEHLVRFCVYII